MAVTSTATPRSNGHLPQPRPMSSLVAASRKLSGRRIVRTVPESWQDEAWGLYDEVGELRFVANAHSNALSRARIYVGKLADEPDDDPEPVESGRIRDLFDLIGGGQVGLSQLVQRLAVHLFVAGDGYLCGVPPGILDDDDRLEGQQLSPVEFVPPMGGGPTMQDLSWHALSISEVAIRGKRVTFQLGDRTVMADLDDVHLVRVWRPHPRRWWESDSPVRANLAILRELVGLTRHVSATIDSRLAGAGLLVLGQSVSLVGQLVDGDATIDATEGDEFVNSLIDAMVTPIKDRDSAAAVVPVVIKVPDEVVDKVQHLTFSTPFDDHTHELRDEAIRRLALGLDAPPETLLGMSTANHWSAWQIEDGNVQTHLSPVLALICDALTTDYLRPVLEEAGITDAEQYVIWFDTSDLTQDPDRSGEAQQIHDRWGISNAALRQANGFDETDALVEDNAALEIAIRLVVEHPELITNPGIAVLAEQLQAAIDGTPIDPPEADPTPGFDAEGRPLAPATDPDNEPGATEGGPPDTEDDEPALAASGLPAARSRTSVGPVTADL